MAHAMGKTSEVDALTEIESLFSRGNVKAIRDALLPDEVINAVAVAGYGRPGLGVLAVTTSRVLFARERFARRPFYLSVPIKDVRSVEIERVLGSANVVVDDASGQTFKFVSLRDLERVAALEAALRNQADLLRGHS